MEALLLFAICAFGTVFPVANPELTAMALSLRGELPPLLISAIAAAGQLVTYGVFYVGGAALIEKWAWLHRQVARMRARFATHLEQRFLVVAAFSGAIGLPPAMAVSAIASGVAVPLTHLMPVLFVTRFARYVLLTHFARELGGWFGLT